jgi:hypothetical protein
MHSTAYPLNGIVCRSRHVAWQNACFTESQRMGDEEEASMKVKRFVIAPVIYGLTLFWIAVSSGCGWLPSPGVASIPPYPIAGDEDKIKALRAKYSQAEFDSELRACADDSCRIRARNLILEELMLIVDHGYRIYEGNLIAGRAKWKFGFGATTQALSLASTASTVETSKTIFSGISTLVGSTDTELDKNFYMEQTSYALAHQMQAQRLTLSTHMLVQMHDKTKAYADYSLERELADIEAYYRAGTIAAAVQNVYQGASEKISAAETTRNEKGL